jgi:DNA-binding CsgD family transcriptional regulator
VSEPFTFERLTPRQREVIIRKAEGKTYGQVAYDLGVTEQTVKNHLGLVYARLGAEHLIEALRILGWLRLPANPNHREGTRLDRRESMVIRGASARR